MEEKQTAGSKFPLKGWIEAKVKRVSQGKKEFEPAFEFSIPNLIVNAGIAYVANLLGDADSSSPTKFTHGRIGSNSTGPGNTDTDVLTLLGSGVAAVVTKETTAIAGDTEVFKCTFTATAAWNVREFVLATAASGGTILNRVTFSVDLALNDVLEVTYKVQVQRP